MENLLDGEKQNWQDFEVLWIENNENVLLVAAMTCYNLMYNDHE